MSPCRNSQTSLLKRIEKQQNRKKDDRNGHKIGNQKQFCFCNKVKDNIMEKKDTDVEGIIRQVTAVPLMTMASLTNTTDSQEQYHTPELKLKHYLDRTR